MKVQFNANEFYKFSMSLKKAPKKNTTRILDNIFFTSAGAIVVDLVNKAKIEVKAVDSDQFEKAFLLPYASVLKALDQLKTAKTVKAESLENKNVLIADGRIVVAGPNFSGEDVPEAYNFNEELQDVSAELFTKASEALNFCSTDCTRQSLTGVFINLEDGSYCGTDGYHMRAGTVDCGDGTPEVNTILPPALFGYMASGKIKPNECKIQVSEHKTMLNTGDITIHCVNVGGPYPNYNAVIPSEFEHSVKVNKSELLAAMGAVKAFVPSDKRLAIRFDVNTLYINVMNHVAGAEKTVKISCTNSGEAFSMGFNFDFLKKILENITGETVKFNANEPLSPTLWNDPENMGTINLLMPMKLGEDHSFNTSEAETIEAPSVIKKKTVKRSTVDVEALRAELKEQLRPMVIEELRKELREQILAELNGKITV